ncbi:glycoside hydrolase family 88 protein [Catenovulum sp. 2E275]|uniref:glycoside hydrolase family 88 protein n=1 Tax=Catenovulum sp. 2E275 TaxID=2980497 RepID=UPI0021D23C6F|nr:glycoside hydrolase family 88 protein [Catenovulum sp. 2E275]MCU4677346.1 glycoside hydrolase family 88 protein [Catenovulum sp. 2E275]
MSNFRETSADVGQSIIREDLLNQDKFLNAKPLSQSLLAQAKATVLKKVAQNIEYFKDQYPEPAAENGIYKKIDNVEWTSGFWSGQLWLAYQLSGDKPFLEAALAQIPSYKHRIDNRIEVDHHDHGFLYLLSCVAGHKIVGDETAKQAALQSADCLYERYIESGGIIQAWGHLNDPAEAGRMIIDCNLNLPILYWASEQTGDAKYKEAANCHIRKALKYLIRDNASTFHTYFIDTVTGEGKYGATHQGHADDSCWARGQAWGISGFPFVYRYYPAPALIEQACRVSNYFLNRLPDDLVCYWDLDFTQGDEPRDSSAAAIAVCGLLELVKYLPLQDPDRETYLIAAKAIMASLIENYSCDSNVPGTGLLKHAVYHKPKNIGVDDYCTWGDYFYMEALVRLEQIWEPYW